jgi:hypothetical protein
MHIIMILSILNYSQVLSAFNLFIYLLNIFHYMNQHKTGFQSILDSILGVISCYQS